MNYIKENSTFYHGDLEIIQLGGPVEWEKNFNGKPNWKLNQEELSYYISKKTKKALHIPKNICVKIVIKKGFVTDGGSFKNMIVPVINATPTGKFFRAFLLHDALVRTNHFTWEETNIILDDALELLGMKWSPRQRIYYALKLFGSSTEDLELLENAEKYVEIETMELVL